MRIFLLKVMCAFSVRTTRLHGIQQGIELPSLDLLSIYFKEIFFEDQAVYRTKAAIFIVFSQATSSLQNRVFDNILKRYI